MAMILDPRQHISLYTTWALNFLIIMSEKIFHILFDLAGKIISVKERSIDFSEITSRTKSPSYSNQMIKDLSSNTVHWEVVVGKLFKMFWHSRGWKLCIEKKTLLTLGVLSYLHTWIVNWNARKIAWD